MGFGRSNVLEWRLDPITSPSQSGLFDYNSIPWPIETEAERSGENSHLFVLKFTDKRYLST